MNIIERTQYSADGGETWKETRELAAADGVRSSLAVAVSRYDKSSCWNVASDVMRLCTHNPDALIAALRDMGALPVEADGNWKLHAIDAAFRKAVVDGYITSPDGQCYAVVPVEQNKKEKAALSYIVGSAKALSPSARDWCDANGINWRDD